MGYDTADVYYQPDKFGLVPVAEIDYSDGSYQFDLRVVWRHDDGTLYTARDSGCSCPSPFEDYTSLEHLDTLDMDTLRYELAQELGSEYRHITASEATAFLMKVTAPGPDVTPCNSWSPGR